MGLETQSNVENLTLEIEENKVKVVLKPGQYKLKDLEQFQKSLVGRRNLLVGEIKEATEEILIIDYSKPSYTSSLESIVKDSSMVERLQIAQSVCCLRYFFGSTLQPYIHPSNTFVSGEEVYFAHRGFMNSLAPHVTDFDGFYKQFRALVLYILFPNYVFDELIDAGNLVEGELAKKIYDLNSMDEVYDLISEELVNQQKKIESESKVVNRNYYYVFKWGALLLLVLSVVLGVIMINLTQNTIPLKERIITAETNYISDDYSEVMSGLKEDNPSDLPQSAMYVYAMSAIQLDTLSNEQKKTILNNISMKTNKNTLLYWIYVGRGDYDNALDVSQNIGDNQLILYSYVKLYNAIKIDTKMNGEKKQEQMKKYEEEIAKYMEILGENADGFTTK